MLSIPRFLRVRYEYWLWQITKYYLEPYADFVADEYSFTLRKNPFAEEKIHPGPYRLGRNIEDVNIYRTGHPLAQRIIEQCKRLFSLPATTNSISDLVSDVKVENEHAPCPSQEGSKHTPNPLSGGDLGVGSRVKNLINHVAQKQQAEILQMNAKRNAGFFDTEMEKLDRWAENVKSSMEIELKELDRNNRTVYYQVETYIIVS